MINFILFMVALCTSVGFGFMFYVACRFVKDTYNYLTQPLEDVEQ